MMRALHPAMKRLLRAPPLAWIAAFVVVAWTVVAFTASGLAPFDPLQQDVVNRLAPPSAAHWAGTDPLGRDVWSRILHGARISVPIGIFAVILAALLGTLVGMLAGSLGKAADETLMRLADLMLAFPSVILALIITAALGAGVRNALIAIAIAWWPQYARLVRGLVLAAKEREYVQAAYAVGASEAQVMLRHVLPNIAPSVIVIATLDIGHAILTFASLSFLGLGPPPEVAEWGAMVAAGRHYFDQWWLGTFPGLAILSIALAFNILGDSLRDAFDPRLRGL